MTGPARLILFDVDGTLVDSQADICAAMAAAFGACGMAVPERSAILAIVGLSLDRAMARLAPAQAAMQDMLVAAYKDAFHARRLAQGAGFAPLYPGALETLRRLAAEPDTQLGLATGKSRRGLDAVLAAHGLGGMFVTRQVADDHPSKPHPSMIRAAMAETGADAAATVMIGDTSFDMDMARAAGVGAIGVGWGYHPRAHLTAAHRVIDRFDELPQALDDIRTRPA